MKILLVGGGGREHAIAWKLQQSARVEKIFMAPGNGGTSQLPKTENINIAATDVQALLAFAQRNNVELTVIGPDDPLALGVVDEFIKNNLRIFGPSQMAAKLEWSKGFAKNLMQEIGVPTSDFQDFDNEKDAQDFILKKPFATPGFVVKADGLALGKGVIVCEDAKDANLAIARMFSGEFGSAAKTILIEEKISGPELSLLCFTDGHHVELMTPARDHKRIFDNDTGPNTGGMGAFAPVPEISKEMLNEIKTKILEPTVRAMADGGTPYKGVLYAGLMLTTDGIKVIEFNCRFGDPETQVILPLLQTDLVEIIEACIDGTLSKLSVQWKNEACVVVVMASKNYPGSYLTGLEITGLNALPKNVLAFHAGTKQDGTRTLTTGGRVLGITASGTTLAEALKNAYTGVSAVQFEGAHFRKDIGNTNNSYAQSGVNISEGTRAVDLIRQAVQSTHGPNVLAGVGAFAGVMDVAALQKMQRPLLVASTDGVGTKTMVAAKMDAWQNIGADIVNHGINDILVQGATPLFFMDYIASAKLRAEWVQVVVTSMAEACKAANCALLGGETAEMPGVYQIGESDVAGTIVGFLEHNQLIDGSQTQVGDAIIALGSSGLHTNGYSLARRALAALDWNIAMTELGGQTIGEALLAPHCSYLQHVQALQKADIEIRAMAHITGGGLWDNIPRTLPKHLAAQLKRGSWDVPEIFKLIAKHGDLHDEHELHHAFNMGVGMTLTVPQSQLSQTMRILETQTGKAFAVGTIVERSKNNKAVELI